MFVETGRSHGNALSIDETQSSRRRSARAVPRTLGHHNGSLNHALRAIPGRRVWSQGRGRADNTCKFDAAHRGYTMMSILRLNRSFDLRCAMPRRSPPSPIMLWPGNTPTPREFLCIGHQHARADGAQLAAHPNSSCPPDPSHCTRSICKTA